MAAVGVDNILVHFGNSSGGTIGSKTVLAEDAARKRAGAVLDALSAKFSDRIVTCHGGAIETQSDFERFLKLDRAWMDMLVAPPPTLPNETSVFKRRGS